MRNIGCVITLVCLASLSSAAFAQQIDSAVIQGGVALLEADGNYAGGCLLEIVPDFSDPFYAHIGVNEPSTAGTDTCESVISLNSCVQITGQIVNTFVASGGGRTITQYQLEASSWRLMDSDGCAYGRPTTRSPHI